MSLNFDEYDTDVPEAVVTTNTSKVTGGIKAPGTEDKAILASTGINPQSSSGLGINPQTINQVWNDVKPYIDPIHYKENTSAAYENIDFPTSIAHGVADVMGAYGVAKGLSYGAKQMFPEPGVAVQRDQMKFQRSEAKRLARGELNPIEKSRLALEQAKTQQILAGLNPAPQAPIAPAPVAPQNAAPSAQAPVAPNAPVTPAPMAPTVQQRAIGSVDPVSAEEKLAAENIKLQPNELTGHVYNKYGVTPTSIDELKMFANQATPEMRASFTPKLIELLNQGVIPKPAVDAGVTPTTSAPEAQTLVTSHEAALDLGEKAQEKVSVTEPTKEVKGAVKPKASKIPEGMTKEEFGMKNHLLGTYGGKNEPLAHEAYDMVKNILGYTPAFPPGEGGGLEPKETEKILGYRKENIHGPKVNLTHEMKKIIKGGGVASLLALPAFINAKTLDEKKAILKDAAEGLLPIGMTPTEAGAPVLPPGAYSESKKLGSPFHVFPNQGRGIMPPSAYR